MSNTFSRSVGILLFLLIFIRISVGQQINNLTFRLEGTTIVINYDLLGDTDKSYFITAFASHNNFTESLQFVTGSNTSQDNLRFELYRENSLVNDLGQVQEPIVLPLLPN